MARGGLISYIETRPKGYCTLRLKAATADAFIEVIDLRRDRRIETDDAGYLKVHRKAMKVDWYEEMPRIIEFCERNGTDKIEIRLYET